MVMGCVVSVYLDKRGPVVRLGVAPIPLVADSGTQVYTGLHKHTQGYTSIHRATHYTVHATQVYNTIVLQSKGRHADLRYTSTCWSRAFIPLKSVLFKRLYVASTMYGAHYRQCTQKNHLGMVLLQTCKTHVHRKEKYILSLYTAPSTSLAEQCWQANGCQLIVDTTKLSQLREGTASPTMTV